MYEYNTSHVDLLGFSALPARHGRCSSPRRMKLTVHIRRGRSGEFLAYCPDLPGASATGCCEEEAVLHLRRRIDEGEPHEACDLVHVRLDVVRLSGHGGGRRV